MESIPTKDIAIAVLGGSTAIASIMLVFVGFMIVKIEGLPTGITQQKLASYKRVVTLGLLPVFVQTLVTLASYLWLFHPENGVFFYCWAVGFVIALFLFFGYAALVTVGDKLWP